MPFKRYDDHASAAEKGHIVDDGKIVGIDVEFELGSEVKAIFVKETSVDGIVARHIFDLCSIKKESLARLRNVSKAHPRKPCDIFAWSLAIAVGVDTQSFRSCGTTVIAEHLQNALAQGAFAITGGCTVHNEHTLVASISADAVTESLLKESCFVGISAHNFGHKPFKPRTVCVGVIRHI